MNTITAPPVLKTRREWDALGYAVPLNSKPAATELRDGKPVALFAPEQTRPKLQPGEACNWSFKLLRLPGNLEWVRGQFDLASHYATVLRKIELERRRDCDDLLCVMFPEYRDVMNAIDAAEKRFRDLVDDVRRTNQRARRRVDTGEQRDAIAAARSERNALYDRRAKLTPALYRDPAYKAAAAPIDALAKRQNETARDNARAAGLGWGTCGSVDEGASDLRKGPPPNLRREGAESLYAQMQGQKNKPPLTWERILSGQDTRIRGRISGKLAVVEVRMGGERTEGQWVECAFMLHRKRPNGEHGLPIGAVVKGVRLCRRPCGYRDEWNIVFTLERRGGFEQQPRAETGRVAVDVGYRKLPHGVRVAYWVGDDGRWGEVVIPDGPDKGLPAIPQALHGFGDGGGASAVGYYLKPRELQRVRDENFDAMIASLGEWCRGHDGLPEWLGEEAKVLHEVKSKERMLAMRDHWAANRFPGDEDGYTVLDRWRAWKDTDGKTHGELHLSAWENEQRAKFARWRKSYYRTFWARLRKEYATVIFEDMKLSDLRNGKPDPDEEKTRGDDYANMASLYLFRELGGYRGAKQRVDTSTVYVDPANTTATCHKCGHLCEWDQSRHLRHQCERCGAEWDQDANACHNCLQADGTTGVAKTDR